MGKEKFYRKLELELDAGLTAEEVLNEAETEFERVEREMYVIARQLWSGTHPGKALPPDDAKGRTETIRLVLDRLNQGARQAGRPGPRCAGQGRRHQGVHHGQRHPAPARARPLQDHRDAGVSAGQFARLSESGAAAGSQGVELLRRQPAAERLGRAPRRDAVCEEYNRHMLQILTIHEAYPGHYVQLEYSNRHPSLIRRVLFSGVFAEGWAVYTEQMMLDQGYGKGDLALRLNQLKWYLRSVVNAILDHKMHCTDMTDDEAMAFLTDGPSSPRARRWPRSSAPSRVRASFRRTSSAAWRFTVLRQQIQRELGDQFDLGRYHEAVLEHGTLPVKYLPELVRERLKRPRG